MISSFTWRPGWTWPYQWKHGVLFPRLDRPGTNYGFGEPRFIFYPPLFVDPRRGPQPPSCRFRGCPRLLFCFTQTLAGISAFFLIAQTDWKNPGLLGRRLLCGESLRTARQLRFAATSPNSSPAPFFPLLLLAALRLAGLLKDERSRRFPDHFVRHSPSPELWLCNAPRRRHCQLFHGASIRVGRAYATVMGTSASRHHRSCAGLWSSPLFIFCPRPMSSDG